MRFPHVFKIMTDCKLNPKMKVQISSSGINSCVVLDLLRGHPSTRLLPAKTISEAASIALTSPALPSDSYAEIRTTVLTGYGHPLHYGPDYGNENIRHEIGRWCAERYALTDPIPAERINLTNGASYGLVSVLLQSTSPGTGYTKRAFVVSPTYFLAARILEDAGFAGKMTAIKSTKTTIDFEGLIEKLRHFDATEPDVPLEEGLRPILRKGTSHELKKIYKFILYCVPTFSNPTGESWDLKTRERLVEIAREWDILLVSDDVYDFLANDGDDSNRYNGKLLPRLVTLDAQTLTDKKSAGNTISNCSFSKLLGPGLRAGWTESATNVLAKQQAEGGGNHSGGTPGHFASTVIYPLLVQTRHSPGEAPSRKVDEIICILTATYTQRCTVIKGAIKKLLPGDTEIWGGHGGFFIWIMLPPDINAREVVALAAVKEKVIVASGDLSECPGEELGWGDHYIRIAVSYCEADELVEGVTRLARALKRWRAGERVREESIEVK